MDERPAAALSFPLPFSVFPLIPYLFSRSSPFSPLSCRGSSPARGAPPAGRSMAAKMRGGLRPGLGSGGAGAAPPDPGSGGAGAALPGPGGGDARAGVRPSPSGGCAPRADAAGLGGGATRPRRQKRTGSVAKPRSAALGGAAEARRPGRATRERGRQRWRAPGRRLPAGGG